MSSSFVASRTVNVKLEYLADGISKQSVQGILSAYKCLHTDTEIKHHTRANKFQGKTYQANSPATKERSPELQDTGCPKSPQNHKHLITHYWTLHCTPERRKKYSSTHQNMDTSFPNQETLTRHLYKPTHSVSSHESSIQSLPCFLYPLILAMISNVQSSQNYLSVLF